MAKPRPNFLRTVETTVETFLKHESASGLLLAGVSLVAMLAANTDFSVTYFAILQFKIAGLSVQHWVNDGLMTIFFFVVGMEIKKELVTGELSSVRKATLPIVGAIGGMVVPALIYYGFNPTGADARGWGIPMATDIAFALGVLTLFGRRVPLALKVFLLALAIVDDLGAVLVIAIFYTKNINGQGLALAAIALSLMLIARHNLVKSYWAYFALGSIVWLGVLLSGVHATIAGVVVGLITPVSFAVAKNSADKYSPLDDLVHRFHPWVSFGVMPIFAFANAGIDLRSIEMAQVFGHPIFQGVTFGLVAGKPVGVLSFVVVAVALRLCALPRGVHWRHIAAAAVLAGIGFTMSLFISGLALNPEQEVYSKMGIILGSVVSGVVGSVIMLWASRWPSSCSLKT